MPKQLLFTAEKLTTVFSTFQALIESIEGARYRTPILEMFEEIGERYYTAPAAHKGEFHNSCPGGLAEHSLRVYKIASGLLQQYVKTGYTEDDVIVAALMHDLGKIGDRTTDYYVPNDSDWHIEKLGQYYKFNPDLRYMPHTQRSLQLLGEFGVPLSRNMYEGILLHEGQYVPANKDYAMHESKFALMMHWADRLACEIEKESWEAIQ